MATCTTVTVREPFPRAPTPRPLSTLSLVTKRMSYQSLRSPRSPDVMTPSLLTPLTPLSPLRGRQFSTDQTLEEAPEWENINLVSPSTASHHSIYSDDDGFRSPRLALLTSNIHTTHSRASSTERHTLISPSAPVQLPGDELLYSIETEARPDERYFSPNFQTALTNTKQELKDISLAIWGCPAAHQLGSDLYALKQWAQDLSEFEPARTRTVGLVGDSGVGKSSLINSLLDQSELAHSNNDNGNSTCVVTEYRYRAAHHDEPFGLEVDYMTAEEVTELIEELLRTFKDPYQPALQEVDALPERKDIRERSEKAWDTLFCMFRNQAIFTREFILEYPTNSTIPLTSVLQTWAAEFVSRRPGGIDSRTWSSTAFSVDECTEKLDAFIRTPVDDNAPALWPYVRVVRVYLRSPILQSGVVLVDCPSLRNLNCARVRATERYLRNCHEIFAVTSMDRAIDDRGIVDIIQRNGQHRPLRIVCTKSEDINPRDVERREPEVALQVKTWRQQIETLAKQVKRSEAQRRHGLAGALDEELRHKDMLQELDFGLKKFLIERRNTRIANQLLDKYAEEVQMSNLKVFCVSNQLYQHHRFDEQIQAETRLNLSGILALRKYCHSIPADAQFAAAASFVDHDAPAFLGSLRQWALDGNDDFTLDKATEVRQLMMGLEVDTIQKLVLPTAHIHTVRTNLNREFASSIIMPIRDNRTEWRNAALEASIEWSKWDAKDYAAFCRHHGMFQTKATGRRSWNEDLISPMRLQLQGNWEFFQESVASSKQELITAVHAVFDELCEPLKQVEDTAPNAVRNLLDNMRPRRDCVIRIIDAGFEDVVEGTCQIEADTLYGHTSSYINTLMLPAYRACNAIAPSPLAHEQRKHIIASHITASRLFPKLATMVERHHRSFVRAAFDAMLGEITREVDNLVRDFHLVVPEEEKVVSEEDETKNVVRLKKSEAARFPEFATRLRLRLIQADGVVISMKEIVREIRAAQDLNKCTTG